jgi:hypothetical protein
MTVATTDNVLEQCGLHPVALQSDGLPALGSDEVFKKTFDRVSLVAGGSHDLGEGQLHFSSMCAASLGRCLDLLLLRSLAK